MVKNRIGFIDIAKGIGIILVVWLHMPDIDKLPHFNEWGGYITTFYMPLFFLMSGMFYKPIKLVNKLKKLFIPYIYFYIIAFTLFIVKSLLKHDKIDYFNFFVPFRGGTIGYQNTPIWFLLSLMEIIIIVYPICKLLKRNYGLIAGFFLGVSGYFLGRSQIAISYYLDVSLLCIPFFLVGFYFKEFILYRLSLIPSIIMIISSVLIFVLRPGFTNVSQNFVPQGFILFFLVAIFANLGIVGMCKSMCRTGIIAFLGENSLIVMCTHMMLMTIATFLVNYILNIWVANILGLILIVALEMPISIFIKKYAPFLIDK
jgi:fucose 4-O-acetylase-like acetyltransferase